MASENNHQTRTKIPLGEALPSGLKSMTIVFSDLKSYTQMAKSMHASTLKELLDAYLLEMTQIIERFDGTVDKIMGDGILALFTSPHSAAKQAKNAVEAALNMQATSEVLRREWQQLGGSIDLQVRIGIASGEVVISESKARSSKGKTAIGDVVNLASRLQEKAVPGTLLVSEPTYFHIAQEFPCRQIKELELKGFADAYSAYEVLGRSADLGNPLEGVGGGLHINSEKRISPRQPLSIDIEYTIDGEHFVHRSADVSETGLFIASPHTQPIGTPLILQTTVPTERGDLPITLKGKVVRIVPKGNPTGFAIQFASVEAADLETISCFINSIYGLADLSRARTAKDDLSVEVDFLPPNVLSKPNDTLVPVSCHELGCGAATHLTARLLHEFRRTKRYNHEFSCIAVRVDQLLELGPTRAKVEALKLVAQQINFTIRNTDEVFYLNEGVFVVLAPETMANRVQTLSKRIIREIHHFLKIQAPEFSELRVRAGTFSFDGRNAPDHNQILVNALGSCH